MSIPFLMYGQRGSPISTPHPNVILDADPVLMELVQHVDSSRIVASLARLEAFRTRHSSSDSIVAARDWLVSKFQEYGYADVTLHAFTWSSRTLHNVVVTKQGRRYPNKFVLLIGHYDSISEIPTTFAPGVNDNGSGIALMLEVARILSSKQLDYSLRFVCFSAEEQGLIGSNAYVNNVVVPENHDIKLVINVDEIGGYVGYSNTMVKVESDQDNNPPGNNQASAAFTDTLATLTRTYSSLTTTITEAYGSDYVSFENRGYVITGFYEGQESPHYHHSTDNLANMDPGYLCQITRAALSGVAYFAGIQRKYLSVYHTPQGDTQDSSHVVRVEATVKTSSPVNLARLVYRTNWVPANTESTMVPISTQGDTIVFHGWIPKQQYRTVVSYYIRVSSTDSLTATFPPDTLNPVVYSVVPDTIPPRIVHDPLPNRSYRDAPFEVTALLSDTNGIADASVTYRINGGADTTVSMVQLSADLWSGIMVGSFSAGDLVEYKIDARDHSFSRNITSLPAVGRFSFRVLNSILYDFEASDGGFVPSVDWQCGVIATPDIPAPPHGQRVWGTNLSGNYSNNSVSELLSPVIDLAGKTDAVLTFKHFYNIEPQNDGGNVAISIDSGAFQIVNPQGGYPWNFVASLGGPGYSGNSFVWKDARFVVSDMSNHHVQIRLTFASDLLTAQRGWYVDDLRIDYLDSISVGVAQRAELFPTSTDLLQNYPNPFNPTTVIKFQLSVSGLVHLAVYDVLGREVATLKNEVMLPGRHHVVFNASELASGVYLYRLAVGGTVQSRKLMILR